MNKTTKHYRQTSFSRGQHSVSFHDGTQFHKDGSPFFDIRIFKNRKDANAFVKRLVKEGYLEN